MKEKNGNSTFPVFLKLRFIAVQLLYNVVLVSATQQSKSVIHVHVCVPLCVCVCARARALCGFSRIQLFVTLWTVAHQASPSMGFSRQEYWSGLPFFLQGIFPTQGLNRGLLHHRQILYSLGHQETLGIKVDLFNKIFSMFDRTKDNHLLYVFS